MATATNQTPVAGRNGPHKDVRDKDRTSRDRIVGIVLLVVMVLVAALMIWLASLGGGASSNSFDYWPMMP